LSNPGDADDRPITDVRDLAEYFASGAKPPAEWTIGTEHEAFGFGLTGFAPPTYEQKGGIADLLAAIQAAEGLTPILDHGNTIGLKGHGGASLSLEPGGQFELSGAMLPDLHATKAELDGHIARLHAITPWAFIRLPPARTCPSCRKAATKSCANTCPKSAPAGWT
jgi:glutamate--cysteine ligase